MTNRADAAIGDFDQGVDAAPPRQSSRRASAPKTAGGRDDGPLAVQRSQRPGPRQPNPLRHPGRLEAASVREPGPRTNVSAEARANSSGAGAASAPALSRRLSLKCLYSAASKYPGLLVGMDDVAFAHDPRGRVADDLAPRLLDCRLIGASRARRCRELIHGAEPGAPVGAPA
ncbi:hypothetical protein [Nocardia beijingensis]|uniref:Uncharacterized protein n=1 Tax=Nocardia beijingensis TaxID=95162 RepID=A0ABW7WIF9_9NOCA